MNFTHISGQDWQAFRERFPSAYAFLQDAASRGEENALSRELARGYLSREREAWIRDRLADFARIREAFSGLPDR